LHGQEDASTRELRRDLAICQEQLSKLQEDHRNKLVELQQSHENELVRMAEVSS
jgi:hypothetical protein